MDRGELSLSLLILQVRLRTSWQRHWFESETCSYTSKIANWPAGSTHSWNWKFFHPQDYQHRA